MQATSPRRLVVASALTLILVVQGSAQSPTAPATDPRFDRVAEMVQQQMKALGVPGVAIGILADGAVRTRGFGVTNVAHPLPVTDDTLFQIGSISKTFTGTAIMRLVEQNTLGLDDPIRKHIPAFRMKDADASARATIRDVLTHMGGWEGDFFDDPSSGDDALARVVERMAMLEQTAKVGEMWGYSNSGFYVAGRVIEVVTGKPFEAALRELVLDPVGLSTAFFFPSDVMTRRFAAGHAVQKNIAFVQTPWAISRAANPAGGITTNVGSLLRYAAFHMSDGRNHEGARVLSAESLSQMRRSVVAKAGTDLAMGLTWHLSRVGGLAVAEHNGATNGQTSLLRLVPERQFALAIVTNANVGETLIRHVSRTAMEAYFDVPVPQPAPVAMTTDALQEYAGRYVRQASDITLSVDGDALRVQLTPKMPALNGRVAPPPPAQRVGVHAKDRLMPLQGPNAGESVGEFIRDANGRVAWLRAQGRLHRRIDTPVPTK